jgi:predicted enzyme related to lactoylglutathione lyase
MITDLTHVTIWVTDQDEAKKFYAETLGFEVQQDDSTTIPGYRWLSVAPQHQQQAAIVLGLAMDANQKAMVGKQGTWVLASDNIQVDYERLKGKGVKVHNEPRHNPWGTDVVFEDLYGNTFDLVQSPSR